MVQSIEDGRSLPWPPFWFHSKTKHALSLLCVRMPYHRMFLPRSLPLWIHCRSPGSRSQRLIRASLCSLSGRGHRGEEEDGPDAVRSTARRSGCRRRSSSSALRGVAQSLAREGRWLRWQSPGSHAVSDVLLLTSPRLWLADERFLRFMRAAISPVPIHPPKPLPLPSARCRVTVCLYEEADSIREGNQGYLSPCARSLGYPKVQLRCVSTV